MNEKVLMGISIILYILGGLLVVSIIIGLMCVCDTAENNAENLNIQAYEISARKWLGTNEGQIHCHRWGVCDILPPAPMQPYELMCTNDDCKLVR